MTILGTPHADNLYVGAGNVFFNRNDADGNPTGFRHLGNVESLTITNNITEISKKSSMEGARPIYKKLITGIEQIFNMVLNEYDAQNLAIALLGDTAAYTQDFDTVTSEDLNGGLAIESDKWYDLGAFNADVDSVDQSGALDPAEDYEVNVQAGLIRILSTGAGTAVATTWTGTRPALTGRVIQAGSTPRIDGALRYVSATDQVSGPQVRIDVWKMSIHINGDLPLIGEDFGAFTLQGTVEKDATKPAGEQYFRQIAINELEETPS